MIVISYHLSRTISSLKCRMIITAVCLATRYRRLRFAKNRLQRPIKYLSTGQMLPDSGFSGDLVESSRVVVTAVTAHVPRWSVTRIFRRRRTQRLCRAILLRALASIPPKFDAIILVQRIVFRRSLVIRSLFPPNYGSAIRAIRVCIINASSPVRLRYMMEI